MKYLLICIFLWLASLNKTKSQDSFTFTKKQIDSLLSMKDYYSAAILYQKLEFISQNEQEKKQYKILSAEYFKQCNKYKDAVDILNTIDLSSQNDSITFKVKFQLALLHYLINDFNSAFSHLQEMYLLIYDSSYHFQSYPLYVLILNNLYNWKEAKKYCYKINQYFCSKNPYKYEKNKRIIDSLYHEKKYPKIKNPEKAVFLSTFFPGVGQIYSHHYLEGAISFVSLSAITVISVIGVLNQFYFTSIVAGSYLLAKFYHGGIIQSEFLSNKYNYKHTKAYNETLKQFILNMIK